MQTFLIIAGIATFAVLAYRWGAMVWMLTFTVEDRDESDEHRDPVK